MAQPQQAPGGDRGGVSFQRVRDALEAAGCRVRLRGEAHADAQCPAHDDRHASLSVDHRDGQVLIDCHAGCDTADVIAALALDWPDLWDDGETRRNSGDPAEALHRSRGRRAKNTGAKASAGAADGNRDDPRSWPVVARYPYVDADGVVIGERHRKEPRHPPADGGRAKSFAWRRTDTRGRLVWGKPADLPLYRLPEVLAAVRESRTVYLTEGEKDADAIAAAGATATTVGAVDEPWCEHHTDALTGAHVVITPDRDRAGYRRAGELAAALKHAAASITVAEALTGKDPADHLAAGRTLDTLALVSREALAADPNDAGDGDGAPNNVYTLPSSGAAPEPGHLLRMSQGQWRYSLGEGDPFGRGIYKRGDGGEWTWLGPLPHVLERLARRDGDGRRAGTRYRLALEGDRGGAVVCDADEIRTGEWAGLLDVPLSADDKIIRAAATAIRDVASLAPAREIVPRWHEGALELPPPDVGPPGYGSSTGDGDREREVWREIAAIAAGHPKVALTLGVSLGGVFIQPLRRQSFAYLMVGDARQGKSATLGAAAAVHGDPEHVACPLNVSSIGLTSRLGDLACLPAFYDELGSAGLSPARWEELIFRITEGAQRTIGRKNGGARTSAPWRGVFCATGNTSILGHATNEGVAARVVEVPTPITTNRADAERLEELSPQAYGWPARRLLADPQVEDFRHALADAESDLGIADGGVARTLARHLALAVAGADRLEQLTGATGLREAALTAAHELLSRLVDELAERGIAPGDRLIAAITQAITSRPRAFPTRHEYQQATEGSYGVLARDVEGFTHETGSQVAVLTSHMRAIAAEMGLDDALPGLRQCRDRGQLVTDTTREGLTKQLRIGAWRPDVYVFYLDGTCDTTSPVTNQPPSGNPVTGENVDHGAESDAGAVTGVTGEACPPVTDPVTAEQPSRSTVTSENVEDGENDAGAVTGVTGQQDQTGSSVRDSELGNSETARGGAGDQATAVVADLEGAWLTTGATRELPELATLADVAAWGTSLGLGIEHRHVKPDHGQVWLMPALADRLGLPERQPQGEAATEHPALEPLHADGWQVSRGGLSRWLTVWREGTGQALRIAVVPWLPPDDHPIVAGDPSALELAARLGWFADLLGLSYRVSPAVTGADLIRLCRPPGRRTSVDEAHDPPPPATDRTLETYPLWSRPPTPAERQQPAVVGYDINGQYLAAASSVRLGTSPARHVQAPAFEPAMPGYWYVDPGDWPWPYLPNLFDPQTRGRAGARWHPTPVLAYAQKLGFDIQPTEAWIYDQYSRYLEPWYQTLKQARERLVTPARTDPDAGAVQDTIKLTYAAAIGRLDAETTEGDVLHRPDWRHMLMATARANQLRKLAAMGETTGRYPLAIAHDAVIYAADQPDPQAARPASGKFTLGTGLGQLKPLGAAPMADAAPLLGASDLASMDRLGQLLTEGG